MTTDRVVISESLTIFLCFAIIVAVWMVCLPSCYVINLITDAPNRSGGSWLLLGCVRVLRCISNTVSQCTQSQLCFFSLSKHLCLHTSPAQLVNSTCSGLIVCLFLSRSMYNLSSVINDDTNFWGYRFTFNSNKVYTVFCLFASQKYLCSDYSYVDTSYYLADLKTCDPVSLFDFVTIHNAICAP